MKTGPFCLSGTQKNVIRGAEAVVNMWEAGKWKVLPETDASKMTNLLRRLCKAVKVMRQAEKQAER